MQNAIKYSNGERVILFTSDDSAEIIDHVDEKLQLVGEELLRMEDESGNPLTHADCKNKRLCQGKKAN